MTWPLTQANYPPASIGDLAPAEVLYEFGEPLIFTTYSARGRLLLAYTSAESIADCTTRLIVVPTSASLIRKLKRGILTVYEALDQPVVWAVDRLFDGSVCRAQELSELTQVPEAFLPSIDRTLWPELMPLFSCRLLGREVVEGAIRASVVARAVQGTTAALKKLLEVVKAVGPQTGRPLDSHRRDYDLVTQHFAFRSFEVGFVAKARSDGDQAADAIYEDAGRRLRVALDWAAEGPVSSPPTIEMLEVLKQLVPPSQGDIERVELRGRMLPNIVDRPVVLTRAASMRVRSAIAELRERNRLLLETEGRVREFDKDELTFTLRERPADDEDLNCQFSEQLFDDVNEAFSTDARVIVQGRMASSRNVLDVTDLQILPAQLDLLSARRN
jgi:hypothetical protein